MLTREEREKLKIDALEWKQFDRVKNEGGRADCQDDFEPGGRYVKLTVELLVFSVKAFE